jgi:hypothetical protein
MVFKPFGKKYNFLDTTLIKDFHPYFKKPLHDWMFGLLERAEVLKIEDNYISGRKWVVNTHFINYLQIDFRETFPSEWHDFYQFVFEDTSRICNFLAYCLQKYAVEEDAIDLEIILSQGGSGYAARKTKANASPYEHGVYDLTERVEEIVSQQAKKALTQNDILMEAWVACYSTKPDYSKVVIECQNFLELLLRDLYETGNTKPQLGRLIGNLKGKSEKLKFKGETVLTNRSDILKLIDNIPQFRGIHTAGTGKIPNKEEAEFVLHTTIYIWNLHQRG